MADYEFPPDLIAAQQAFWKAEQRVSAAYAALPSSVSIAAQEADVTEEQQRELDEARAEQGRCIDAIYGHSFWDDVADKYAAKVALQKAAKA
ncbi:hypothetical protein AB0J63_26475 [Streptosporangium canum]|uniref:hypothetical protein n=1 Tax=Streptosporangium canum TaxID=324952 RepID=UPI00342168D1